MENFVPVNRDVNTTRILRKKRVLRGQQRPPASLWDDVVLQHMVALCRRLAYTMCFLIAAVTSCTHAADNAATNKLFVEVVQMVKKASAAPPTEAIGLYEQALQHLDRIVASYPGSTLGQVSRIEIEQALLKARQAECAQHPEVACVLVTALETASSIEDNQARAGALGAIAAAQAQAGYKEEAHQTLATALETARSIQGSGRRADALVKIAETMVKLGLK